MLHNRFEIINTYVLKTLGKEEFFMGHNHNEGANKKVLLISFIMITGYMIIEAIGGFLTNSLALLSDAGHMLSDSISLMVALIAFTLAEKRQITIRHSAINDLRFLQL